MVLPVLHSEIPCCYPVVGLLAGLFSSLDYEPFLEGRDYFS